MSTPSSQSTKLNTPSTSSTPSQNSAKSSQTSSDSFEVSRQTANQKKTKFVVRKIPTFVTEDELKQHLDEFIQKYNWYYFCSQPDIPNPTRQNKNKYNRFYINFISFDDAIPFIEKFQKLTFTKPQPQAQDQKVDNSPWAKYVKPKQNIPHKLCVEFAPNQSLPNEITSKDRRINTIKKDSDYLQFVQSLEDEKEYVQKTSKMAGEKLIRRNVMLVKKISSKSSKSSEKKTAADNSSDDETEKKKETQIAPLAQHVATKRHRRQLYSKKIDRASLVKSEKAKEKKIERIREQRRRKRIALAKAAKYGKKQWTSKPAKQKHKRSDRDREQYNEGEYDDRRYYDHDHDHDKKKNRYYEEWDREYDSVRRRRGGGRGRGRYRGGRGRGGGGGGGYRDDISQPHFSGYSRRKGQQTWKAK